MAGAVAGAVGVSPGHSRGYLQATAAIISAADVSITSTKPLKTAKLGAFEALGTELKGEDAKAFQRNPCKQKTSPTQATRDGRNPSRGATDCRPSQLSLTTDKPISGLALIARLTPNVQSNPNTSCPGTGTPPFRRALIKPAANPKKSGLKRSNRLIAEQSIFPPNPAGGTVSSPCWPRPREWSGGPRTLQGTTTGEMQLSGGVGGLKNRQQAPENTGRTISC